MHVFISSGSDGFTIIYYFIWYFTTLYISASGFTKMPIAFQSKLNVRDLCERLRPEKYNHVTVFLELLCYGTE